MPPTRSRCDSRRRHDDPHFEATANDEAPPSLAEPISKTEHYAEQLREKGAAIFLFASMSPTVKDIEAPAYFLYRDRLLADCGSPTDPIEVMLLEQLAMAHLNMGLLHCKAASSDSVECAGVYTQAAARLMAEFRRSSLALQAYRLASRQLANDPARDIVMPAVEAELAEDCSAKKFIDDEVRTVTEGSDAGKTIIPYPGPADLGDRQAQPPEMARVHAGRKRKAPRRGAGEPAVGEVNRAANS